MIKTDLQIIRSAVDKVCIDAGVPATSLIDVVDLAKKRGHFFIQARKAWRAPTVGDFEKTCAFLPLMNKLHGQKGIILFIPTQEDQ